VADANKAAWEQMQQKATQELVHGQRHQLSLAKIRSAAE
jgi:hypothetical protein